MTLDNLSIGERAIILDCPSIPLMECLGCRKGKELCLKCKSCFGGSYVLEIEDRLIALKKELTEKIQIMPTTIDTTFS